MLLPIIFTVVGMVFLAVFLFLRVKNGATAPGVLVKSWVSLCFMATAVSAAFLSRNNDENLVFSVLVIFGLLFGLLGDIWLDQKYAHPESSRVYTYAGFFSFLIGHIFYDAAMIKRFYVPGNRISLILPVGFALLVGFLELFGEDLLKVKYGEYKAVCCVYTCFLVSFATISGSLARLHGHDCITLNIMFAASLLFIISDAILNATYFGEGKNRPVDIVVNHATYYLAQFAVALSLCFLSR